MSTTADWTEAMATVLECRYDAGALHSMAFGIPRNAHFLIRFNYWAGDTLRAAQLHAETAIPQGTLFPILYNPADPSDVRRPTSANT